MKKSKVIDERYTHICFFCGKPTEGAVHHLAFGNRIRELADEDGLFVPICNDCHTSGRVIDRVHDNIMAEKLSKMLAQAVYERNLIAEKGVNIDEARRSFQRRYGKAYF